MVGQLRSTNMCGKPKVVEQDPEGDARRAAELAAAETNVKKSMRRTSSALGSTLSDTTANAKSKLGGG